MTLGLGWGAYQVELVAQWAASGCRMYLCFKRARAGARTHGHTCVHVCTCVNLCLLCVCVCARAVAPEVAHQ